MKQRGGYSGVNASSRLRENRREPVKSRLVATVVVASLALSATLMPIEPVYAQPAAGSSGRTLIPIVVGALVGGAVGMLVWPMVVPMGAGVMAGVAAPEAAAGAAAGVPAAGAWSWDAIMATRTLVGAGIGAFAGFLFSR
jgi:hypothetical protein